MRDGYAWIETTRKKKCIITIRNRDALCCARAIVTMRAHCHKDQDVDGFRGWDNLKRGRPVQQRQAQALHQQARVAPISTGVGAPISIAGDDPDETVFSDIQRTRSPSSDSFTEIR